MGPEITIVGSFAVGLTMRAPKLPIFGETMLGSDFDMGPGGKGSNQAVGTARLGAHSALVAMIGTDKLAGIATDLYAAEAVDTTHLTVRARARDRRRLHHPQREGREFHHSRHGRERAYGRRRRGRGREPNRRKLCRHGGAGGSGRSGVASDGARPQAWRANDSQSRSGPGAAAGDLRERRLFDAERERAAHSPRPPGRTIRARRASSRRSCASAGFGPSSSRSGARAR